MNALTQKTSPQRVYSHIDLRRFADEPGAAEKHAAQDVFFASRRYLDLAPGPVSIGTLRLDRSRGTVAALDADEFIIVRLLAYRLCGFGFPSREIRSHNRTARG